MVTVAIRTGFKCSTMEDQKTDADHFHGNTQGWESSIYMCMSDMRGHMQDTTGANPLQPF